jgi:serine/threonine protein kinase
MLNRKYIIQEQIGAGQFGQVYKGINHKTREQVAIKTENCDVIVKILKHETAILNYLYHHSCNLIPLVYWFGTHLDKTCLIMTFYECSLQTFFLNRIKYKKISQAELFYIMVQMILVMKSVHLNSIIHRDIKPDNFMIRHTGIGRFDGIEIHLIDFGMATFIQEPDNGEQDNGEPDNGKPDNELPVYERSHIIGTPRFISYYIHIGSQPGFRDDMISIGYIFILFIFGEMFWDNKTSNNGVGSPKIYEKTHILYPMNQLFKKYKDIEYIKSNIIERVGRKDQNHYIPFVIENAKSDPSSDIHYAVNIRLCNTKIVENITKYIEYCYNCNGGSKLNYDGLMDLFTVF